MTRTHGVTDMAYKDFKVLPKDESYTRFARVTSQVLEDAGGDMRLAISHETLGLI